MEVKVGVYWEGRVGGMAMYQEHPSIGQFRHQESFSSSIANSSIANGGPITNEAVIGDSPTKLDIPVNRNDFITYMFHDFNAVKYFEKDMKLNEKVYVYEEVDVLGFDLYLVEQWVMDRKIGTVVATFTGNMESKIKMKKLTIQKKQSKYYPVKFQEYLNELVLNHCKTKPIEITPKIIVQSKENHDLDQDHKDESHEFENNTTYDSNQVEQVGFVTNLASLKSNLNLIPIPGGDPRLVETDFVVNSNLKKFQCCGRSISLISPNISDAHADKFRQMYKIHNTNVPIRFAIRELVNVIQIALFYFDLLDPKYTDGLLCSKTDEAINTWWNLIGLPHYNFKPSTRAGILPATTVAAIISLTLSVRIRLNIFGGCDVPKDPFDFENFMLSIGQFQKQVKFEKKRKLDLETLNKLFTITNAKLIPSKNSNNFDYGNLNSVDVEFQAQITPNKTNTPIVPSKKSRHYYSKEFKKLKNVVRTTVQDHINAAGGRDDDDLVNSKSGEKLRSKIAKYSETDNPFDIETLDLESLVKNHISGKTLIRLFHGVKSNLSPDNNNTSLLSISSGQHKHDKRTQRSRNPRSSQYSKILGEYTFVSLRDKITQTQAVLNTDFGELSRYSRGLNKVRLGLSSKRSTTVHKKYNDVLSAGENYLLKDSSNSSNNACIHHGLVDSLLQLTNEHNCAEIDNNCSNISDTNACVLVSEKPLDALLRRLNRRSSFPFIFRNYEFNLNILGTIQTNDIVEETLNEAKFARRRSKSCSEIDDYSFIVRDEPLETVNKFSNVYLKTLDRKLEYDVLRKYFEEEIPYKDSAIVTNGALKLKYKTLNFELLKLNNAHTQMTFNKRKIIDEDLSQNLQYQIKTLNSSVDRLTYETRVVQKRINELEDTSRDFVNSVKEEIYKLDKIIEILVKSKIFHQVYTDQERAEFRLRLTGTSEEVEPIKKTRNPSFDIQEGGVLAFFIYYAYNIINYFSPMLQFDRSNMNLDRIRKVWNQLDPNRNVINKAYNIIGKEPSPNTSSFDTSPEKDENSS